MVVTDGLQAYQRAFKKEFYSRYKKDRVEHIRKPRFVDHTNNNIVERLNGTIREREKVTRNVKEQAPTIIEGYRNYYNLVRPHQALNGKTPAEIANINLNLKGNKWLELIRQSKSKGSVNP